MGTEQLSDVFAVDQNILVLASFVIRLGIADGQGIIPCRCCIDIQCHRIAAVRQMHGSAAGCTCEGYSFCCIVTNKRNLNADSPEKTYIFAQSI